MAPIKLINKRTYADFTETPRKPRFKDFDNIEYADTYSKWSIHVRVDVKFLPNKYNDNISFVLMDKTGAKIEATVWGNAEVARFNRILQPGCKYTIHRVTISPNAESVEFRAIEHLFECRFDRKTVVEPSLPIEFPILPKHLMPFSDVAKRPNKTFVDIVGIVVHCCELERFGRYGKYREAIFADAWGNLIAVGIRGLQLIQSSYLWSTAEGGNPIVIATMLQKDIKFGN
ncbi:uncharacterized protein LOC124679230 [Lolium rigidum]|uniref:uncharacterized protein LOC124679230 n=1 Tax=Lolium rigidum TaxID=89674 RepID=UPI001F5C0CB3|nr:uncharacterized protein LOC124679230 [Lolium rigidum]